MSSPERDYDDVAPRHPSLSARLAAWHALDWEDFVALMASFDDDVDAPSRRRPQLIGVRIRPDAGHAKSE